MIDAVLSYHLTPATCGVAKFNQQLAARLGVSLLPLGSPCAYPLVSVKPEEAPPDTVLVNRYPFDLFLHGMGAERLLSAPATIYAANAAIAEAVRPFRPDVIEAFCPATIQGNPHRGALNVLTFGMAHKLQTAHYHKLKQLLDATGCDYTISLSTAVHEGSPWSRVAEAGDQLRAIFGRRTRVLGYLLDDALAKELRDCSAVALFFDPAVRANNTTYWAARETCDLVISNYDAQSPEAPGVGRYDIRALTAWPGEVREVWYEWRAPRVHSHPYTWDALLQRMGVSTAV